MVVLVYNKSGSRPGSVTRRRRDSRSSSAGFTLGHASPPLTAAVASEDNVQSRSSSVWLPGAQRTPEGHLGGGYNLSEGYTEAERALLLAESSDGFVTDPLQLSGRQRALTEPEGPLGTAERSLLEDAQLGAEQQAACRDTMLSLRAAFEGALSMNAQVEAMRQKDRARLAQLQAQHNADQRRLQELLRQLDSQDNARTAELRAELEGYRLKEEETKVEKWKDRFKKHRGCLQVVMLLARRTHPLGALSMDSLGTVAHGNPERTFGDNLTLGWVMKLWKHHISRRDYVRDYDKGTQADPPCNDCQAQTDDALFSPALLEQLQLELEAERHKSQSLQDQVMDLNYDMKKADQLKTEAEQERDVLAGQLTDAIHAHKHEKDRLLDEVLKLRGETQSQLGQKEQELRQLRQQLESQRDAFQREKAAYENEKRAMKANLRDVSSELQQALTQARRMQLLAEKLKKEGAGALKDRIAQLIADLDGARSKLVIAAKERDDAVDQMDGLHRKLGQTTRKMELERQFLPLIHLARGPVGESRTIHKTSASRSEPKLPSIANPEMLQ